MDLAAPPYSRHRRHQSFHQTIQKSPTKISLLHTFHTPQASSLSPITQKHSKTLLTPANPLPRLPSLPQQITTLCHSGRLAEALSLLRLELNNVSSHSTAQKAKAVNILLQACGQQKDIDVGRETEKLVRASTQFKNDYVINTRIITMYSTCGYPHDSRRVFDHLQRKNLYQWNALISGYTRNELWVEAVEVFCGLVTTGDYKPDNFTFPCVIKCCGGRFDVGLGQAVHGMVVKMGLGLCSDEFVCNAMIAMYGRCGFVEEAGRVFDKMQKKSLISWNSMISAFSENGLAQEGLNVLREMLEEGEEGLLPDVATMATVLPLCAGEGEVGMGMLVHGFAVKLGLTLDLIVSNCLVDMYSKCGFLPEAQRVFDKNGDKNVVSWNSMIGAYSRGGRVDRTLGLLREMQTECLKTRADEVTILNVLPVCLYKSQLLNVKELHGHSLRNGFQYDVLVANMFISAYAKCGALISAQNVLHGMEKKRVSSWNALIGGYAQKGEPSKALDVYYKMTHSGLDPDLFSIGSLLLAFAHLKSLKYGKEVHSFVLRNGLDTDSFITISLLSLYIHCGEPQLAQVLFDGMEDKNLVSWNTMISGYCQHGLPNETLNTISEMVANGTQPDEISVTCTLGACSQLSVLQLGKEIHCYALKAHLTEDLFVACKIIDMYAKCGSIELSRKVFDQQKVKDVALWTVMISGCGIHGHGKEGLELFEKMRSLGLKPDGITLIGLLMGCSHSGLVEEGLNYFNQMQPVYGLEPKLEHYACVVDMLGRSGRFHDAIKLVNEMPMEPDVGIWSSLLSSCRTHSEMGLGEKIADRLLELGPDKAVHYVLVSNLFAVSGNWDGVRRVRGKMRELGLKKDAGCSWIEVGGKIYNFSMGDEQIPKSEGIREIWRRLEEKISGIGYVHDTSSVLHDLKEEEKIEILRGHSEKLAISYGLLKMKKGATIRVSKNLRICGDCHSSIKLISKVVDRKIVVRDNKRFHHFSNGLCSCGDYW